jgi:hypothetical protein
MRHYLISITLIEIRLMTPIGRLTLVARELQILGILGRIHIIIHKEVVVH